MAELVFLFGYFIGIVALALCIYYWRKSLQLHKLLLQNSNHYLALRDSHQKLAGENQQNLERLQKYKDALSGIEKKLAAIETRHNQDLATADAQLTAQTERSHKHELSVAHLKDQVAAMTEQLRDADRLRYLAEQKLLEVEKQNLAATHAQQKSAQAKIQNLEQELKAALLKAAPVKDVDAEKTLQRKITHYETLFKNMRSLRDLADERSRNLEIALRKLSLWIVGKTRPDLQTQLANEPFGKILGAAMEISGNYFVEDEFSPKAAPTRNKQAEG